jgi:fido (protein-threonine AMPylation protein)
MAKSEPLNSADFDLMKEIWTVSALDGIRGSLYGKELEAAMHEVRVTNALAHDRESINVGEERIRAIIDGDEPMTHNEHLVQGFDRAMMTVIRDRDRLDFDERSMVSLHRTLFSGVMCEKGRFRDGMDDAMVELFEDYRSQKTEVLAFLPRLMDDFLRTAPFRDGNKRMRALLACLILLKNGYTAQVYVGMDWEGPMLPSLTASYKELDRRYPLVENRKVKKRDRIYHIIETSPSPVKKRDICACIPDVSIRTADVVLSDLINQNRVEKLGSFKDAKYIPAGY